MPNAPLRTVLVATLSCGIALGATGGTAVAAELPRTPDLVGSFVGGSFLVVHTAVGRPFLVDTTILPGTALRAWWVDPRTGA